MNPHALKRKRERVARLQLAAKHLKLTSLLPKLDFATENNATLMQFDETAVAFEIVEAVAAKEEAAEKKRQATRAKRAAKQENGDS